MADSAPQAQSMGRQPTDSIRERITRDPAPAMRWGAIAAVLVIVQFGSLLSGLATVLDATVVGLTGLVEVLVGLVAPGAARVAVDVQLAISGFLDGIRSFARGLPTLLSRDLIPNQGYRAGPNGPWKGTFLGLQPALAWAVRAALVVGYSVFSFYWVFRGWLVFREHYRAADWTPSDDVVDRLRGHYWGQFGIVVLILFLTMALFGPTLGTTTVDQNIISPYSYDLNYYDEGAGEVKTVPVGQANFDSKSKGSVEQNVGPLTYDDYDRFHVFGTLPNGRDLFSYMMGGARITLIVAGVAIGLAALVAVLLSMVSAYYRGTVDLTVLTVSDGVISIPQLLLLIMVSFVFQNHWLGEALNGGLLLALVFGMTTWPFLWRSVRGPALQVAGEEWIMAAQSFGQRPRTIMRKHMLPYVLGYLLVYASMTVGGIIISLSALSFLGNGLGITQPTPAWGRAVSQGQNYVSSASWHISLISGLMIVVLVVGLNALGDGVRDAIDPESGAGENDSEEAAMGGGG
jgi:ABC-type dipeptide/oligopeptide/nickel transport systems, permease components